jgi:serine/threonine protein kinase
MINLIGISLGRYRVLDQLGVGGMATVFKAYDTRLERIVAIKVIQNDREQPDPNFLQRFELEAKTLAQLSHPNIVPVYDFGEQNGIFYVVMEYLPGATLKERLGRTMQHQEAARLLAPIARALEYAHHRKIIHRDIKPANIFITLSGQPMLLDFGLAKMLEAKNHITGIGIGIGTPDYMAPEQWMGNSDHRSDIYALGIVYYELVTGTRPFASDTPAAVMFKQINEQLPRPRIFNSSLPDEVEQVILKALAKNPEDRYQDIGHMASALEKVVETYRPVQELAYISQRLDLTQIKGNNGSIPDTYLRPRIIYHHLFWIPLVGMTTLMLCAITLLLASDRINDGSLLSSTTPIIEQEAPKPVCLPAATPTAAPRVSGKFPSLPPVASTVVPTPTEDPSIGSPITDGCRSP